jgi:hypothetical protein
MNNPEIDVALHILAGDTADARDLQIAAAYLGRAGKYSLANDIREQSQSKRKLADKQRMRIVSAITRDAHFDDINPAVILAALTASPKRLACALQCAGLIEPQPSDE